MFGSSGLNKLSECADISPAAAAYLPVEILNIFDHIAGAVDPYLITIPLFDFVPTNTAVAEHWEAPTTAEAASSTVPHGPTEVFFWSCPSHALQQIEPGSV